MALKSRLTWRRRVRALLHDTNGDLGSLLAYNTKHPSDGLIDIGTLAAIVIVQDWISAKLSQKTLS